jgi:hypothetical protein
VRVYILGAGFSRHAGYPLANGLIDEMDDFVKSDNNADAEMKAQWAEMQHMLANGDGSDALHAAVKEAYRLRNAEALISFLDAVRNVAYASSERDVHEYIAAKETGSGLIERRFSHSDKFRSSSEAETKIRDCLVNALTAYFEWRNHRDTTSGAASQWKLIHEFCDQCLRPGDAVISFNYDCSLERVLLQQGRFAVKYTKNWPNIQFLIPNIMEPKHAAEDKREILLLKLHGSVGWQQFLHQVCVGIPSQHLQDLGAKSEIDYPDDGDWTLATNRTMIVPTWFKTFHPDHLFAQLWKQALEVMLNASEVIVIGYSFPPGDSAAWVLRQAGLRQWKFVDRRVGEEYPLHHSFESWMQNKDSR